MNPTTSPRRVNAMVVRHLYMFPRTLDRWSESVYWPVLDLVLWGLTTRWVESSRGDVPHLALAVLTAVVFWQVVWRANYEISVNLLEEVWNQNLVNLFSTPLTVWEWSVSLIVLGVLKNVVTMAVGAVSVWVLYRMNIFTLGWMMLPFLFSLMMSGWFMGFTASALIIRYGKNLQSLAWMAGYALAPFSAVFYPVGVLPGWARAVASALPMTYVFECMREILRGGQAPVSDLLMSFGLNALYLALSVVFFGRMFEKSRERGLARLE
jgi:ABC-2 type transport system permease protein